MFIGEGSHASGSGSSFGSTSSGPRTTSTGIRSNRSVPTRTSHTVSCQVVPTSLSGERSPALFEGGLLAIQRLARMDEETLRSRRVRSRFGWQRRSDTSVRGTGFGRISTLESWRGGFESANRVSIARTRRSSRGTIEELKRLANGRLFDRLESRRKDGLQYEKRRLCLPADSEIPGEPSTVGDRDGLPVDRRSRR